MTIFFDGQRVRWAENGVEAEGHIVALATTAAHVKWSSGPQTGTITFADLYDIEPVTASVAAEEDPLHLTAVRHAFDTSKETGVLNFLASNGYLANWTKLAQDVVAYTEDCLRKDASMELVDEQLTIAEKQQVIRTAALALLRDSFGIEEE